MQSHKTKVKLTKLRVRADLIGSVSGFQIYAN
jgi:hypothetical protein